LPEAFRILTDPAETGAATVSLAEDVQAEAFDWPAEFFEKRVWHMRRPLPEPELIKARKAAGQAFGDWNLSELATTRKLNFIGVK
jgi:TPP-dependent trihydroxycyclohexane-1,2-dione (THcHDO) dehydratase